MATNKKKNKPSPFNEFSLYYETKPPGVGGTKGGEEARKAAKTAPETAAEAPIYSGIGCTLSMLDYSLPPKQTDVERPLFETKITSSILPQEGEGSLRFHVEPSGDNVCISLFDSVFFFRCQIVHDDLSELAETENVSIVPYALNTQFRRVQLDINGQTLTSSTNTNHQYESYVAALANLSDATKRFQLSSGLFYPDVESDANSINNWASLPETSNLKVRSSYVAKSQKFELIGRIISELMLAPKLLPPFTEVVITLTLAPNNFIIIASPAKRYRYRVLEAKLYLAKFVLTKSALLRQFQLLHSQGLHFLFPKFDTRVITAHAGAQSIEQEVSRGSCPDKIYVIVLDQSSYIENKIESNCLHLAPHKLESLQLFLNGDARPSIPYSVDNDPLTGAVHADRSYFLLMKESNLVNQSLSISLADYQSAMFFLIIDLSRDHSASFRQSYFSSSPDGTIVAKIKFSTPLTTAKNLLFILEYNAVMRLTGDRRISCTV